MDKVNCNKSSFFLFLVSVFYSILVGTGYLEFEIWGQIENYRSKYLSNGGFFLSPHILRYLVIHPVYQISSISGLDLGLVYSFYVIFSALCISKIWDSVRKSYLTPKPSFSFLIGIPFIVLFFINGRFIFGLLGLSILLGCVVSLEFKKFKIKHILLIIVGFFFSSVSSGMFFVGVLFTTVSIFDIYRRRPKFITLPMKVVLIVPIIFVGYFSFVFLQKNLTYFIVHTGSILGILRHGLGFLFISDAYHRLCTPGEPGFECSVLSIFNGEVRVVLLFTILIFLLVIFIIAGKVNILPRIAARGLLISAFGGIFGLTTLFSFIFVTPLIFLKKRSS